MKGLLTYYRFLLDNGNTIAVEATSRIEAKIRAENNLSTTKIIKDL